MWRYLRAAFWISPEIRGLGKVPVNLAAVLGFAILGFGNPGFWLLGLALETVFVFTLASNPRFRKYVDATKVRVARAPAADCEGTVKRILQALPPALVARFDTLRQHCRDLQKIALELQDTERGDAAPPLEELQVAGLDRLLWIYLRLLFTRHMLEEFFQRASEKQIRQDIRNLEEELRRLAPAPGQSASRQKEKMQRAVQDNLQTCRERLDNYQKAHEHGELVRLEIDRLENKIRALSELAVNRHEPHFIAGQVDQVVSGMVQTERTMSELQFATGLAVDDQVPHFLQRPLARQV